MRFRKIMIWVIGILSFLYLFGAAMFVGRYPCHVYIDGRPACFKTQAELSLELMRFTTNRTIKIVAADGSSETVPIGQFGIFRPSDVIAVPKITSAWTWPVSLFRRRDISLDNSFSYTESVMREGIEKLNCVIYGTEPPRDAYVARNEDGTYEIVPDKPGTQIDRDALRDAILRAISDGWVVDLFADGCYHQAAARLDDRMLTAARDTANRFQDLSICLDMGGGIVVPLTQTAFGSLNGDAFVIRPDAVAQYVHKIAEKYNTVGTVRRFLTSTGKQITIMPSDTDNFGGWQLDEARLTDTILMVLMENIDCTIRVPWISEGAAHGMHNDFGDTYLEISIPEQHMWLYENGVLTMDTDVVTGMAGDPTLETPTGMFKTSDFYREHTMTGSYGSAFVHYFIRVTWDGVGIHDASWRSHFGGNDYLTDGSHGCINTPYDAEKYIYEHLAARDTATPIIIW